MSQASESTRHLSGFLKSHANKFAPSSVVEMADAAGIGSAELSINEETAQMYGESYGRVEAVKKVKDFATSNFWSNPSVQCLQRWAEAGIATAEEMIGDLQLQIERLKEKRDHFNCIQMRPLLPCGGRDARYSKLHLLACGILIAAIAFCWYLEWLNATTLALGLSFLNLGTTVEEMHQRASALVFVLVVMIPIIAKVREVFLTEAEELLFRRRVFRIGAWSAVLLILTWGAMGWVNTSEFDPLAMDVEETANGTGARTLMACFYVLQLSTFAIGTFGLTVMLERCWFKARPMVVEESDVAQGVNKVMRKKRRKLKFWMAVKTNCKGVLTLLEQSLKAVLEDAEIRVIAACCYKELDEASYRKRRRDERRQEREETQTKKFHQFPNNLDKENKDVA